MTDILRFIFKKETSKFQYSVGTIYSYDYSGETASKIGGTSEQESRLHIGAQAEFEVVSQCEFVLRVTIRSIPGLFIHSLILCGESS